MKKLWGVRHVRWLFLAWRVQRWARLWGSMGIGLGFINDRDKKVLDQIWKGER